MHPKSRRPVVFRVVLAFAVVAGLLIAQGSPAMADTVSDLGFTYSASPTGSSGDPWVAGNNVTLTATVTNYGPDAAPDNTVTIGIPGGTNYVSNDSSCTGTGVLTCAGGALAASGSRTINVIIKVQSNIAQGANLGPLNAYVQTTGGEGSNTHSDSASITNAYVHRIANIAVVKAGPDGIDPNLIVAGDNGGYDYTITVSTAGPSDTNYVVHDTLADGLTFDSSDAGCSAVGQDVSCGGTIAAGADPQVITIHVLVDPSVADGTILDNDATVAVPDDGTTDSDLTNNTTAGDGTVSTTITAQANLGLTVSATAGQNAAGATAGVDFTYTVSTTGPSNNVGGFKVTDALPPGFVFKSADSSAACGASGQNITCTDSSDFPAGAVDRTFTVHAHINSSVLANDYSDLATVTSLGTQDPHGDNDTDSGTVTVIVRANLALSTAAITYPAGQTAAYSNIFPTQNFVIYEYDVKNNGPSDSGPITFDDSLPTDLTLVGACTGTGCSPVNVLPLSVGSLNGNDGTATLETTHVRVKATVSAGLSNGPLPEADSASVALTPSSNDPVLTNNTRSESATVWTVPSAPTSPQARPGNTNAFFLWQESDVSASNGGSAIDSFRPTVTGLNAPSLADVPVGDSCGTSGNQVTFCTGASPLTNGQTYTFVVKAHNVVGFSDPTSGVTATPSIDASAKQINTGNLSQQTGNTANPTKTDPQISLQNFPSGTTGVGTILETSTGSTTFCGSSTAPGPCVGKIVKTKLLDPNLAGTYTITLLYDKTLVGGTGQKYSFFYAASDTAPNGQVLKTCPKNITVSALPCVEVKLGSGGANPALKAIIHTSDPDPTIGGRAYPK
jgi:uncharacterized repeat protein (TIGR01451 family)